MCNKVCSRCNQEIVRPEKSIGTGYAMDKDDNIYCYPCCGELDKESMIETGDIWLYLIEDKREITNWPGTLRFKTAMIWKGGHNWWNTEQVYARFIGPDNKVWSGRMVNGGYTQLIHCKRTKYNSVYA